MTATATARSPMMSSYSHTGRWEDHVEFEYVSYYAKKLDDVATIDGVKRCSKRYAYELPDGRWLCGVRRRERDNDKVALEQPVWLDAPDFERVIAAPDSVDYDSRIGHYYLGCDHHLYVVVDMFYFGSPGWDAVIEPVFVDPQGRPEDACFRWISARAIDRTYHHSRRCPCVAHLPHPYGAR